MNPNIKQSVVRALSPPDDAYFGLNGAAVSALQNQVAALVQPLPMSQPPGQASQPLPELRVVGAPTRIDWQHREVFPLLLAEVRTNRREWEVNSQLNRWWLVSNLTTGNVDAVSSRVRGRRMPALTPSRSGSPPDEFNAGVSLIGVELHNLINWFPRDRLQGRVAITVLDFDLTSNTVMVEALDTHTSSRNLAPDTRAPRLEVERSSPAEGPVGVRLHLPAEAATATTPMLQVDLKLFRTQVTAVDAKPAAGRDLLLAASLVMLQLDGAAPLVVNLAVPAQSGTMGTVDATFSLDVRGTLAGRAAAGNWLLYLVVGDTVTGPRSLRVGPG